MTATASIHKTLSISRVCLLVLTLAVLSTSNANNELQKGVERRTMADAFYEHKQVYNQRRMRMGATKTRGSRGEMRTVSERGGGGGRNRNSDGMSVKARGGRDGIRTRGGRNVDGVRIGARGKNADGTSKNGNRGIDAVDGEVSVRGAGRGGGNNRLRGVDAGKNRTKTPRVGKNNNDGEHPGNSRVNTRKNGESMASAVLKAGINLVPVESSANTSTKGKRKGGN
jgi:hypothetical protein